MALGILLSRRVWRLLNTPVLHILLGCHNKNMGDGEKLLTYLNSALKVLLGTDIFPVSQKKC
jgi:hypothetical protein